MQYGKKSPEWSMPRPATAYELVLSLRHWMLDQGLGLTTSEVAKGGESSVEPVFDVVAIS